jgi:putative hydrolase of the HAD superfamily
LRAVLFDLDGTLHDRAATVRGWLTGHVTRHALPAGYAERFTVLDDLGYRPKREVMALLVREFGLPHDPEVLFGDFSDHAFRAPVPMPHAHDVLRDLRTGVVTNGRVDQQTRTLAGLGLNDLIDDVLISGGVGLSKPDPAIYTLALLRLGVSAADAWFVGDSPRNDVWGPQQVGLRAAYLPTGHPLKGERPDAVLRDLRNVLTLQ